MTQYLISLLLSLVVLTPPDINGWKKTTWGMKEAELIKAVPEARLLEKPEIYGYGRYATLSIPDYEALTLHFRVYFQMDSASKSLCGVIMKYNGKDPKEYFSAIGTTLIEKYGAPVDKEDNPSSHQWIWVFPKTRITLSYFNEPSIKYEGLTIYYNSISLGESQKF